MCTVLDETKTEGQVFTPVGIVSMILDSVKYTGKTVLTKSIMEPSFGKGVFLIEIVSRIIHEGKAEGKTEGRMETAVELMKEKFPMEKIAKVTKLSMEKLQELGRMNGLL